MSRESLEYDPEKKEFRRMSAPVSAPGSFIQPSPDKKEMPVVNPRVSADLDEVDEVHRKSRELPVDPLNKPPSAVRHSRRQKQHMVWMLIGASMVFWVLMMLVVFLRGGDEPDPQPDSKPIQRLPFAS